MAKSKRILWLSAAMTPALEQKQAALSKLHYDCLWVRSLEHLAFELSQKRAPIIIVSEGQTQQQSEDLLLGLVTLTEARGARWLLSLTQHHPSVIQLAACSNFRDFIPLDLPESQWIYRVLFSSSRLLTAYPFPSTFLTLDHPANLAFPCRIIWLNSQTLRLECHVRPPLGSILTLSGSLFSKLGAETIQFKVNKIDKTRLSFRFSAALEGSWQAPCSAQIFSHLMQQMAVFKAKPKLRVYLAIKNSDLRQHLIQSFAAKNFDINSALQIQNLPYEPVFFSPDVIIIEDVLCSAPHQEHFEHMLKQVNPSIPLVILGSLNNNSALTQEFQNHNLHTLAIYSEAALEALLLPLLPKTDHLIDMHANTFYTESNSLLSCALIQIQGRLSALETTTVLISSPYPVKDFSYCQITSPFLQKKLKKSPWLKITELRDPLFSSDPAMTTGAGGFFTDLSQHEKSQFVAGLISFIDKVFNAKLVWHDSQPKSERDITMLEAGATQASLVAPEDISFATPAKAAAVPLVPADKTKPGLKTQARQQSQGLKFSLSKNILYVIWVLVALGATIALLDYLAPRLAEHYQKSGGVYSDQLQRFQKLRKPNHEK